MMQAPTGASRVISPVMLDGEWSMIGRLVGTLACSTFGVLMNGFYVACFFVEQYLQRIGMLFMACVGLADLIITGTVIPVSAVTLLSGQWDTDYVCYTLQFIVEGATYSYCVFFALVALETYYRLCTSTAEYEKFLSIRVGLVSLSIFIICFTVAAVGVFLDLDSDYCRRSHMGNMKFRITTAVIFYAIPSVITVYCLISATNSMKKRAKRSGHYRRSQLYEQDATKNNLNIFTYIMFVGAWTPYMMVLFRYPESTDSRYYHSAWLGVARSVISCFFYACIDTHFRHAYAHLFNYCCCKSTMSGSFAGRHRRAMEYKCATGDVKVHIMHQAVKVNSPPRAESSTRETQEL